VSAPPPEDPEGSRDPRDLDFDAEFRRIVADWTPPEAQDPSSEATDPPVEPPDLSGEAQDPSVEPVEPSVEPVEPSVEPVDANLRNLFRQAWADADEPPPPDPDEHFVPPPAPPIPRPEPRRLLAWSGMLLAPMLALLLLVLGSLPTYASFLLFSWFVGGFGYLVATMKDGGRDGWDDGARV
jgi:hypothetical protein